MPYICPKGLLVFVTRYMYNSVFNGFSEKEKIMLTQNMVPPELLALEQTTIVYGDIDAFMKYFESGQAERDWHERRAGILRDLEELLTSSILNRLYVSVSSPEVSTDWFRIFQKPTSLMSTASAFGSGRLLRLPPSRGSHRTSLFFV